MNVLVTGGAGYIGSHTCKLLARCGYLPISLDNLVYGHDWAVKWGPLFRGDINHRPALDQIFSEYKPQAVLHFAAYAYVGESIIDPAKYYRNNVAGTITLLEAMRDNGCKYIVFSSTCATYGVPQTIPIAETHGQSPINPYGHSKWMIEQMLRDFEAAHGIHFISLRYFNAAGADPDGELGEEHDPETHLIPLTIRAALKRHPLLEVYGTDYPTADGSAVRDYIHVVDLAAAHVHALRYLVQRNESSAFNLGTGKGHSVLDVVRAVERVSGRAVPLRKAPRRAGDPAVLIADGRLATAVLNWQPGFTDLDAIIETAWKWHESRVTCS
jgi:UDP-arabinose 4-epimerase